MNTKSAGRVMSYFGSKYRLAKHYPSPRQPLIIEPFAGGAGYALHYPEHQVHLYDLNEKVCGVWDFVIRSSPQEILALPILGPDDTIEGLPDHLPQEAKWLIGWWVAYAVAIPRNSFSTNAKNTLPLLKASVWGERRRSSIARTSTLIKHWKVTNASYESIPNQQATWFIDPPYACKPGREYPHNTIDFPVLADWCESREGQVMVCENSDSPLWLPFTHFKDIVGAKQTDLGLKKTKEVWWTNTGEHLIKEPEQVSIFDLL